MEIKLFLYSHCKQNLVSLRFYHNGKGFKVVNAFTLFKTSCNPTGFISLDITVNISFAFENSFCCQDVLIGRAFNKLPSPIGNKHIILCLQSFFPSTSFIASYCFLEAGLIRHRAFSFACNSNKPLSGLSWYVSQCVLKKGLTRSGIRRIM